MFFDANDQNAMTSLEADLKEDLALIPTSFTISGHPVTVLKFLMEQINKLADHLPSSSLQPAFHGYHDQVIQTLPSHAQHYLKIIGLIGGFPRFATKPSGLTTSTYCLYLDNYLSG
jgi:hypothetical protein